MKRPLVFVCCADEADAAVNCRKLYRLGMMPVSPPLMFGIYLSRQVLEEQAAYNSMAVDMLRRCRILVICGKTVTCDMRAWMQKAHKLNIAITTLDGLEFHQKYIEKTAKT